MAYQKYLLVIDDTLLDKTFQEYFTQFGFQIVQESRLDQHTAHQHKTLDAILINCSLIQGETMIVETLHQQYVAPIIIISDTSNEEICVRMFEAGADDFMVKPIHPRELHARITAITRRIQRAHQPVNHQRETLAFDQWRLYPTSRQLFNNLEEQFLSAKEFDLLLAFVRHPQQVLDRDYLSDITQCHDENPLARRIDVQIYRLRKKIETDAKKPSYIKTIRNNGYLFTAEVHSI